MTGTGHDITVEMVGINLLNGIFSLSLSLCMCVCVCVCVCVCMHACGYNMLVIIIMSVFLERLSM